MFSADANELVIIPIERMISILESLKSNPFVCVLLFSCLKCFRVAAPQMKEMFRQSEL